MNQRGCYVRRIARKRDETERTWLAGIGIRRGDRLPLKIIGKCSGGSSGRAVVEDGHVIDERDGHDSIVDQVCVWKRVEDTIPGSNGSFLRAKRTPSDSNSRSPVAPIGRRYRRRQSDVARIEDSILKKRGQLRRERLGIIWNIARHDYFS